MRTLLIALLSATLSAPYPAPEECVCATDAECEAECDGRICGGRFYCAGWCVEDAEDPLCGPPEVNAAP